ncbi:PAS domain S-box protein [Methylomarinum vadi]|uniref:PAS domain S-box protein n=1 Tax=Methylomarinum vadi TaxID=438855 RepID=UPI000A026EED|nr:PAS domain S-box protein [Methylomarinum vadi]
MELANIKVNLLLLTVPDAESASTDAFLIRQVSNSLCDLLGYQAQELISKPLAMLLADGDQHENWKKAWRQDHRFVPSIVFRHKNGRRINMAINLADLSPGDEVALIIEPDQDESDEAEHTRIMLRAVEQSASAVMITDADSRIEYVNPKYCELTGYSREELIGNTPKLLHTCEQPSLDYREMWETLLSSGQWRGEIKDRKKTGELFWIYETISVIKNKQGDISHFLAIAEDISSRKKFETALVDSEQRFRQMAQMTGEWLWEQDPDGYYIYSSIAVRDILGFQPDEIIGKHYTELLTAQDKADLQPNTGIKQPFYALMNHYRHRDGHMIYTESTGLPIKDEEGKLIKWRGVDRDITARKHFQDALIDSEKRKRLILETALNAIVTMDSYGIVTDWNQQAEKMFGWSRNEAIGQRMADLIVPERFRNEHYQGLQEFLRSGQGKILNRLIEHTAMRRDGTEFPVEFSVAPLKLGNAYEFSGFIHDITVRKETEKKIRQAEVSLAIARNEMKIAQQIQASLLPAAPIKTADFEILGYCLPAAQVGGDYFDYFFRGQDCLDMTIVDVSGHSIGPGLFMVETRSALRAQANWQNSPAKALAALNDFLFDDLNNADYFITMTYLQYNPKTGGLSYANAGHPPALLSRKQNGQCRQLDAEGLVLGVLKQVSFEEKTLAMESGDTVLLYTDGLIEAENPNGEFFGVERVCRLLNDASEQSPKQIIETVLAELKKFCAKEVFADDITLLVFKRY